MVEPAPISELSIENSRPSDEHMHTEQDDFENIDATSIATMLRSSEAIVAGLMEIHGLALAAAPALAAATPDPHLRAIPTYESPGLYWQSPGGKAGCRVRFRAAGEEPCARAILERLGRQALHAWRITLPHPVSRQPLQIEVLPAPDLHRIIDTL